jgi:hypothetical protein
MYKNVMGLLLLLLDRNLADPATSRIDLGQEKERKKVDEKKIETYGCFNFGYYPVQETQAHYGAARSHPAENEFRNDIPASFAKQEDMWRRLSRSSKASRFKAALPTMKRQILSRRRPGHRREPPGFPSSAVFKTNT